MGSERPVKRSTGERQAECSTRIFLGLLGLGSEGEETSQQEACYTAGDKNGHWIRRKGGRGRSKACLLALLAKLLLWQAWLVGSGECLLELHEAITGGWGEEVCSGRSVRSTRDGRRGRKAAVGGLLQSWGCDQGNEFGGKEKGMKIYSQPGASLAGVVRQLLGNVCQSWHQG